MRKKRFKPAIAKKILLSYLQELENERSALLDYNPPNDKALLSALIFNNPTMSPKFDRSTNKQIYKAAWDRLLNNKMSGYNFYRTLTNLTGRDYYDMVVAEMKRRGIKPE